MAALIPLVPTPMVRVGGYELYALAAGRTDRGLLISMTLSNGVVCWADSVVAQDRVLRQEAATVMVQSSKLTLELADYAMLQIFPQAEKTFRERGSGEEWPEALPFTGGKPPAFPIACYPPWLRNMVTAVAEALQVPVDLPAMLALSILGAALAKKQDVQIRQGYFVPLNCYVMVGLESGERKSPTYRAMLKPFVEYERDCITAVKEANKGRDKNDPLPYPQLFADDITTEQVPVVLEQNGERLAIFSDEGDNLDIMAGRYSKGTPNFGAYLKAWDGGAFKVNRGMRPSIYLHKPLLSMGLCVQPSVLRDLAGTPSFRERGLLGRFWFSLPTSFMGVRKPVGTPVPRDVQATYERHIRALLEMPLPDQPEAQVLSFEAHEVLVALALELEPRLGPDGDLRNSKDWVAKLEGSVGRVSGLLHGTLGAVPNTQISAETMRNAVLIGRYLLAHAQGSFGMMKADPAQDKAKTILRWIERRGLTEFSRREVYAANRAHFDEPDECLPALTILVEHGLIAYRTPAKRPTGRPPTPIYDVNPSVHTHNTQNAQNPDSPEETTESEGAHNQHETPRSAKKSTWNSPQEPQYDEIPPVDPGDDDYPF